MEERQKMEVAVFRYGVIQDFVSGIRLDHGERERLLREKCTRKWQIPYTFKSILFTPLVDSVIEGMKRQKNG